MKKAKGFTLIEVLLVIAIVGLLSASIVFTIQNVQGRARDARRVADLDQLQKALDLYINQTGETYPLAPSGICLDGDDLVNTVLKDAELVGQPIVDPSFASGPNCYTYATDADGVEYSVRYYLETSSIGEKGQNIRP